MAQTEKKVLTKLVGHTEQGTKVTVSIGTRRHTWTDGNGGKHVLHTVRKLGRGWGILNLLTNVFVSSMEYETREQAWDALEEHEDEGPRRAGLVE